MKKEKRKKKKIQKKKTKKKKQEKDKKVQITKERTEPALKEKTGSLSFRQASSEHLNIIKGEQHQHERLGTAYTNWGQPT